MPNTMFSDNGTNLKKFSIMMTEAMKVLKEEFHWHFNVPAAPFRGGFFELLIKTMKRAFYSISWQKSIERKDVRRILYRIQAIMNCRPLVHDGENILTPNHLRYGCNPRIPVAPTRIGATPSSLLTYWRGTQRIVSAAWKTYKDVYMKGLRTFYRNQSKNEQVKVGDTVLVIDDHQPAAKWKMGKVLEAFPDPKGIDFQCVSL